MPMTGFADVLKLKDGAPKSYVVKKGDTLWDISGKFLNKPWLWPKLWRLNPEIENPHLIYPGDKLKIVYDKDGQPMLVKGKPQLKWSPKMRTTQKGKQPVNLLPMSELTPFLTYEQALTQSELDALPYVLGGEENHKNMVDGLKVYVKGNLTVGRSYAIYQQGEALIDPVTEELLAYETELLGTAKAIRSGDIENKIPATVFVKSTNREIKAGAKVVAIDENDMMPAYYRMQAAKEGIEGQILKSTHDVREFSKYDIVILNKGAKDSVVVGDVLSVGRKSPAVVETGNGPKYQEDASTLSRLTNGSGYTGSYDMPIEIIGQLMVFKTNPKVSMAIILTSEKSLKKNDMVFTPK